MKTQVIKYLGLAMLALMLTGPQAYAFSLTPGDTNQIGTSNQLSEFTDGSVLAAMFGLSGTLDLYYKAEVGKANDSGLFSSSYETAFLNTANDPKDATITNVAAPAISCPTCIAIVKDGNHNPVQYFFDLTSWNGTDTLEFNNFWPQGGAISNIAIWGQEGGSPPTEIPEPGMLALLGIGLLGISMGRKVN